MKTIFERKSVRSYTQQKVTRQQLEQLIQAGMAAPTAVNKQAWAFVAIDDDSLLKSLGDVLPCAKMLLQATAAIIVCGDLSKTLEGWEQEFWIQDCSAASQNILLAAESMGLGAVWTAVYPAKNRMQTIRFALGLPEHIIPLNVIPIGYHDGNEMPKNKWNPENLHWNKW